MINLNSPEIDQKEVSKLLEHIGKDNYEELIQVFIEETKAYLEVIHWENFKQDKEEVIRAVHSIKGSASSLGLNRLSSKSAELESILKNESQLEKSNIFAEFCNRIAETFHLIQIIE